MTPKAFVIINTEFGEQSDVLKELKKSEIVNYAHEVYGIYDIIAQLEAGEIQEIKDYVEITMKRNISGIRSTLTMPITDEPYYNE